MEGGSLQSLLFSNLYEPMLLRAETVHFVCVHMRVCMHAHAHLCMCVCASTCVYIQIYVFKELQQEFCGIEYIDNIEP